MQFKDIFKLTKAINQAKETEKNFFKYFKHIPNFMRLYWRLFFDKRIPTRLKLMLIGAIFYFAFPVDIIPELMLPFIGYIDDGVLLILAFRYFIKWSPPEVVKEKILAIDKENQEKKLRKKGYTKSE